MRTPIEAMHMFEKLGWRWRGRRARSRLRFLARACFVAALIPLAACSGRAHNVLIPVAEDAPGTSTVSMIVATTRKADANPAEMFSGERGPGLAFAEVAVSIPPDKARTVGEVQWPANLPGNPATDFVTKRAAFINNDAAFSALHKSLAHVPGRRVMLFVHGYNTTFEDAIYRFAQIIHDSSAPVTPVLFTWPSRARVLAYVYDRESANYSRDSLEHILRALSRDPAVGEVSILAHSMGNWVTLEALRQMAIRDGRIAPKIKNVMLAAPDVDVDVFNTQIQDMGAQRPVFTLFVSRDDRALAISRRLSGDIARLGAIDPESEPYRTQLAENKITVLDLTTIKTSGASHHTKFAESSEVVRLIGQRLVEGQTIQDQNVGLGDRIGLITTGAVSTVGATAGLIVSAPIAIVDSNTRENLGEHFHALGNDVADSLGATPDSRAASPAGQNPR